MPPDDLRKRKACQNCTKAKAKCSPSDNADTCYRCKRLNKECIADEVVKKRGPKARSRVKQLEQRVDSLIDLLAANGQTANANSTLPVLASTTPDTSPEAVLHSNEPIHGTKHYITPVETPDNALPGDPPPTRTYYDPIEDGVIDHVSASLLLDEFRDHCVHSFPFVVVPQTTDVDTLRGRLPFLFLAIMAVMTYRQPPIQRKLGEIFKHQIAVRIIDQAHQSLEILEGLLVYAAWYHSFYRPQTQQLSAILQLSLAMVQDLGLAKNPKDKPRKGALFEDCGVLFKVERSTAEWRALLGTYYLNVAYAQAWRHRATCPFTKYMSQCCKLLAEQREEPTDELVAPLIQLARLLDRVNDHFSYDDIDNAEVKGDLILEMSTSSFRSELEQIKSTFPSRFSDNKTLVLMFNVVELWIHEPCLHPSLWDPPAPNTVPALSPRRLKMLHRTVNFIKIFLNILMDTPDQSMYHLALFPWTGWLYANIVACRIVFLQDNEHLCHYIPSEYHTVPLEENHAGPADATAVNWDPGVIAQESGIQDLFERLVDKLKFTFPPGGTTIDVDRDDRDVLFSFACIQRSILNSFSKRIREYASRPGTAPPDPSPPVNPVSTLIPNVDAAQVTPSSTQINAGPGPQPSAPQVPITPQQEYLRQQMASHTIPFIENMNFGGLNFESVQDQPTGSEPMQGVTAGKEYDDWVWNMMMDDFTLMPL